MPRVITNGQPIESAYEPPQAPKRQPELGNTHELAQAIIAGFREVIASMPPPVVNVEAPVVNVPKPEVKINSPVYVQPPEVKVPATTVNVPEGKAPVVNFESPDVILQTNRPKEWEFKIVERNDFGQVVTVRAKAIS